MLRGGWVLINQSKLAAVCVAGWLAKNVRLVNKGVNGEGLQASPADVWENCLIRGS